MKKKKSARKKKKSARNRFPSRRFKRLTVEQAPGMPHDLRQVLEEERLESLILFRTLDRLGVGEREVGKRALLELMELDADCAEALWALDQPARKIAPKPMLRDTLESLKILPARREAYVESLPKSLKAEVQSLRKRVELTVSPHEAYNCVPGRDPSA